VNIRGVNEAIMANFKCMRSARLALALTWQILSKGIHKELLCAPALSSAAQQFFSFVTGSGLALSL
jgi:hypothetical protein